MTLQQGRIEGVNFTRFIGAIGIVIFHFVCYSDALRPYLYETANCPYGQLWVALFFAVSGACVARSNTDTGWWSFYKKRWLGIFPLFYLSYLVIFAAKWFYYGNWWSNIDWHTIPLTLLGVDSYFYYIRPNFSCIGEWFIGALLACYLLFPVLRKMLQLIPYSTMILLLAGCWFIPYLPCFDVEPWHNIWVCTTLFYSGMLLAQFPAVFTSKTGFAVSALLTLVMVAVPLPFKQCAPLAELVYPMVSGLASFVFLTHLGALIERPEKLNRLMPYLGKVAYPVFLIQHTCIFGVRDMFPASGLAATTAVLGIDIVITLFTAALILALYDTALRLIRTKKHSSGPFYLHI